MRGTLGWLAIGASAIGLALSLWPGFPVAALDDRVYSNLLRTRDALLNQRAQLRHALDETASQIDLLRQKLDRLDNYLRQTEQSLTDIDRALRDAG